MPIDYQQAIFWFHKAADQGSQNGQFNLDCMHANGDGVRKNDLLAYFWYLLASAEGDTRAIEHRDRAESLTPKQRAAALADAHIWKARHQ